MLNFPLETQPFSLQFHSLYLLWFWVTSVPIYLLLAPSHDLSGLLRTQCLLPGTFGSAQWSVWRQVESHSVPLSKATAWSAALVTCSHEHDPTMLLLPTGETFGCKPWLEVEQDTSGTGTEGESMWGEIHVLRLLHLQAIRLTWC